MTPLIGNIRRYDISVRIDPDRGGDVSPFVHGGKGAAAELDDTNLLLSGCRHILLLVHGFNDTADEADAAYQEMIDNLKPDLLKMSEPDAIVCFQWPGDYAIGPLKQADAVGYPLDIDRAREAALVLLKYLRQLCDLRGPDFKISIIAHSMGCRLVLEMLAACGGAPLPISIVALMAAAVPVSLVDAAWQGQGGPYLAGTAALTRAMLKFHSTDDWVLWLAFPAGETLAFAMHKEPAEFTEALGYLGDPPGFAQDEPPANHGHGGYWGDKTIEKIIVAKLGAVVPHALPRVHVASRTLSTVQPIAARPPPPARRLQA
jgi:hypothetical protein